MKPRSFLAVFLATFALYFWQTITHMVIPWYHSTLHKFEDPKDFEQTISEQAKVNGKLKDGMYFLPQAEGNSEEAFMAANNRMKEGTFVFASIRHQGKTSFFECLAWQFVFDFMGTLLVAFLLTKLSHDGMGCRVGVTIFFALFLIVMGVLPNWTWWGFSSSFIAFHIFDHLIGWTIVGFVLGKMLPKNEASSDDDEPAAAVAA